MADFVKKSTNLPARPLTPQFASIKLSILKGLTVVQQVCPSRHLSATRRYGGTEHGAKVFGPWCSPVNSSSNEPSPVSEAMTWVSRILAVAAVMVLPGVAGQWGDKHWGLSFLGLAGFAIGLVAGIAYLLAITKLPQKDGNRAKHD